jgi:hypothetical protein
MKVNAHIFFVVHATPRACLASLLFNGMDFLLVVWNAFPPCCWKHHHFLFLLVRCVFVEVERFVAIWPFFFLLYPSLKITSWSFLLLIFQLQYLFFRFLFCSWLFYKSLTIFNLLPWFQFIIYYFFQFGHYSFDFFFFSLTYL